MRRDASTICDCLCAGLCPTTPDLDAFGPGDFDLAQLCPRQSAYLVRYDRVKHWWYSFCVECTASRRSLPELHDIAEIHSIPRSA